jgi:hypothetical protein
MSDANNQSEALHDRPMVKLVVLSRAFEAQDGKFYSAGDVITVSGAVAAVLLNRDDCVLHESEPPLLAHVG